MEKNTKFKLLKKVSDFFEGRQAMFIPMLIVASFLFVGYAAIDKEAPKIYSSEIKLAYGQEFDVDAIDIEDNRDARDLLVVEADTKSLDNKQLGTYSVKVSATDLFNNTATKVIKVEVVDQTGPKFEVQGNNEGYVIQVPVKGSNDVTSYVKATDNVDGDVTPFITADKKLNTKKLGFQTITLTATDSSGNESHATYEFAVSDMEAPVIKLKKGANPVIDYGSDFDLDVIAKVKDNYDSSKKLKVSMEGKVDTKKEEVQEVKIIAEDTSGNKSEATVKCKVEDISAPEIKLSKSKVSVDVGDKFNAKKYLQSATDNKDGNVIKNVKISGNTSTSSAGTKTITYTVTDKAGNTGKATLKLIVNAKNPYNSSSYNATYTGGSVLGYAQSKLGSAYVYGSTGPYAFDCSGFTQWCYRQAGKSIPRTSRAQAAGGQYVSRNNLQPGDLIFYSATKGGGVSHAAMYVGNGRIIHAATGRYGVCYSSINIMNYVTAKRY